MSSKMMALPIRQVISYFAYALQSRSELIVQKTKELLVICASLEEHARCEDGNP